MIFVFAAWEAHVPVVVAAMEAGKPVAFEVGGAYSIDDCRLLIKTYEKTHTPAMMLENCMYGINEMTVTEMARAGVFGEIMHLDGGYMHDLRSEVTLGATTVCATIFPATARIIPRTNWDRYAVFSA